MGSRSQEHGLHGIKRRQPSANQADKARKKKLNAAKQPLLADLRKTLADTPDIA